MSANSLPIITLPLEKLGKTKCEIIAVKPVTKRGGSWQVTVPREVVSSLDLKNKKLVFVKVESDMGIIFLLLQARLITQALRTKRR